MKKRLCTCIILLIFLGIVSGGAFVQSRNENVAYAENKQDLDALVPYEKELEKLNEEWGTNYKIQLEDRYTEQEMIEQYTSMSMEEFREYIRNVHEAEIEAGEKQTNNNIKIEKNILP